MTTSVQAQLNQLALWQQANAMAKQPTAQQPAVQQNAVVQNQTIAPANTQTFPQQVSISSSPITNSTTEKPVTISHPNQRDSKQDSSGHAENPHITKEMALAFAMGIPVYISQHEHTLREVFNKRQEKLFSYQMKKELGQIPMHLLNWLRGKKGLADSVSDMDFNRIVSNPYDGTVLSTLGIKTSNDIPSVRMTVADKGAKLKQVWQYNWGDFLKNKPIDGMTWGEVVRSPKASLKVTGKLMHGSFTKPITDMLTQGRNMVGGVLSSVAIGFMAHDILKSTWEANKEARLKEDGSLQSKLKTFGTTAHTLLRRSSKQIATWFAGSIGFALASGLGVMTPIAALPALPAAVANIPAIGMFASAGWAGFGASLMTGPGLFLGIVGAAALSAVVSYTMDKLWKEPPSLIHKSTDKSIEEGLEKADYEVEKPEETQVQTAESPVTANASTNPFQLTPQQQASLYVPQTS